MFDFRELKELCIPKGPDFSSAKTINVSIAENKAEIRLPKHKPSLKLDTQIIEHNLNNLNNDSFISLPPGRGNTEGKTIYNEIINRSWGFKGPVFAGYVAEIHFMFAVYKSLLNKDEGQSLFNESNFQDFILNDLTNEFGNDIDKYNYYPSRIAPVHWTINNNLETPSIILDIMPHEKSPKNHEKRLYAAISNDCNITLHSTMRQKMNGSSKEKDKLIDRSSMTKLTNAIFSSFKLELSENSKQQLKDARASSNYKPFSKRVDPLKWTTEEQDQMGEEYRQKIASFQ